MELDEPAWHGIPRPVCCSQPHPTRPLCAWHQASPTAPRHSKLSVPRTTPHHTPGAGMPSPADKGLRLKMFEAHPLG